eukprot:scaffold798_cov162-Amphora_coffeaeformis.AAC.7
MGIVFSNREWADFAFGLDATRKLKVAALRSAPAIDISFYSFWGTRTEEQSKERFPLKNTLPQVGAFTRLQLEANGREISDHRSILLRLDVNTLTWDTYLNQARSPCWTIQFHLYRSLSPSIGAPLTFNLGFTKKSAMFCILYHVTSSLQGR